METKSPQFTLAKTTFQIRGTYQPGDYDLDQDEQCQLFVDGVAVSLSDSLKIRNHSPSGFNWGYGGSGPAQSALAICLHIFRNRYVAEALYQSFKEWFVAHWKPQRTPFELTIDLADFLIDNRGVLKQAAEQQVWAEESAGWALVDEAERLVNPSSESEFVHVARPEPVSRYQVGDVVRTSAAFLENPTGSRAMVYELYERSGISLLTETGTDLGGFCIDDQDRYLEYLCHAEGFAYEFRSVHYLYRDWRAGVFIGIFR